MEVVVPPIQATDEIAIVKFCHNNGLQVIESGDYGTYPHSDNSIIEFENEIFCYVDSWADRTVIDPEDGTSKRSDHFGTPVAWITYEPIIAPAETTEKKDDKRLYKALKHETTWSITRKLRDYGFTEAEFVEHNDIPYGDLVEGQTYRLPVPTIPTVARQDISYELFDKPQEVYISRERGTQKWAFGNAKTVKDIISGSGIYPQNKQFEMVAIAYVPIGDETFAYYMDALALGDYRTTGKVRYMIGFAYGDITVGAAPDSSTVPEVAPALVQQIQETLASIEPISDAKPELDETVANPNQWRASYLPFPQPARYVVNLKNGEEEITVRDLEGKRPAKVIRQNGTYKLSGTFWKDGVEYGRPTQAVDVLPENRSWYGIPMEILMSEADLYDGDLSLPDKRALHKSHLTTTERYVIPSFAFTKLSYDRMALYGQKLKKMTKEKIQ